MIRRRSLWSLLLLLFPTSHAFLSPKQQRHQHYGKSRTEHLSAVPTQPSVSSSSSSNKKLPTVEFIDPQSQCHVVLLGCFHGTESSSADVQQVVTPDTDAVVLELCVTRFDDLKRAFEETTPIMNNKPWAVAYLEMIGKTTQQRGLPTGLAAAVLGGVSGLQTALSGFTPGLEFTTALEKSMEYDCDIVLADQEVEETLRQIGSLPQASFQMLMQAHKQNPLQELEVHAQTLKRAVFGDGSTNPPQVQLGQVLTRNEAAIQDLVRLTIPPILLFSILMQILMANNLVVDAIPPDTSFIEMIPHWCASLGIMTSSYVGLVLPSVRVILTERDAILTKGIQAACQRAGPGGRVVAVLGLLHVNGIAARMMMTEAGATATTNENEQETAS